MHAVLLRRLLLLLILGVSVLAAPAHADALPAGCHNSDVFGPDVASMKHVYSCLNGGRAIQVLQYHNPGGVLATQLQSDPDAGGPSCDWAIHYFAKWCYSAGLPYLICDQFFYNTNLDLHGHHCANPFYDDGQSFSDLWDHVVNLTQNHVFRKCTVGALIGGTGKWAGAVVVGDSAGPVGIMVLAGIGCVGGVISYYWN
jgi:hypothetical protein